VKLVVTKAASRELEAAAEWYERREPTVGRQFLGEVNRSLETLRQSPKA